MKPYIRQSAANGIGIESNGFVKSAEGTRAVMDIAGGGRYGDFGFEGGFKGEALKRDKETGFTAGCRRRHADRNRRKRFSRIDIPMVAYAALASFDDFTPESDDFLSDVLAGLNRTPKTLPCKYFYDRHGSDLFNEICELPEYYPTRTEKALLLDCAAEIAEAIGPKCRLIEYGTGSSDKMRIMLDALDRPAAFVAVDISREHLLQATAALATERPDLEVHAVCTDFTKPFNVPSVENGDGGKAVAFFPGSSLGNFHPNQASGFLANAAHVVDAGGGMVIGLDLKKDDRILNAAYNDSAGVTAAFNKNILRRINHELNGSFVLDDFEHRAFYNEAKGRVEMHLISRRDQTVRIAGHEFRFRAGEGIHTENSYKYDIDEFQNLALGAGFRPIQVWTDPDRLFSVHYLEVPN